MEAYRKGELDFDELHEEFRFYQKAKERLSEMKKELRQVRARLLQHRL